LAEQSEPVKRRVALKVIKQGMDTKQVVARFEAERQALALMDHPAVAKVFDAGATPQGRPYFVMEHVKGVPLTEHCDRQKLTTRQRLELFMDVCAGVQHAHQKAIIHRDLKPTNVLVTIQEGKAVPKIIDFGVAKATAQKLTEKTLFTELGTLIGTPEYMSPEQAEMTGQNVDTRTDVYSLGVMLYELLAGALPFAAKELRSAGFEGIRRKIRDDEPPTPSKRVSTLGEGSTASANARKTTPSTLQRQLQGDLDWITMRALEKDRTRRYGSPSELAADIGRHLKDEPVVAGPPSAAYRARKFVRRHRAGVVAATIGVVVLLIFSVTMTLQARRIATERDRANEERAASDRVSEFLADMLGSVDPEAMGGALLKDLEERITRAQRRRGGAGGNPEQELASFKKALSGVNPTGAALYLLDEQILSRAGETVERTLSEDPRIAGRLEDTLGVTYRKLGLNEKAERHALRAVKLREQELGMDHPETLNSMDNLAIVYAVQGRYAEAEPLFVKVLETRKRVLGDDNPCTASVET
ncbi:MAG: protein kinase, partial [Candidatus Binatia bacterium]